MGILFGVILALTAVGLIFFFKHKADKAEVDGLLSETKGKDSILIIDENEVQAAVDFLNKGIEDMKKKQEAEARDRARNMTLKERADRIKKGLS